MRTRPPVRRSAGLVAAAVLGFGSIGVATAMPAAADVVTTNSVVTAPANTCAVTFLLVGASGGDTSGGVGGLGAFLEVRDWVHVGDTFYVEPGQLPIGSTGGLGGGGNEGGRANGGDGGVNGAGGGGGTSVRFGGDPNGEVWATAAGGGGAGTTADGGRASSGTGESVGAVHGGQPGVGPDPGGPGYRDPVDRHRGEGNVAGGLGQETNGGGGGGGWSGGGGGGSDATDGAGGGAGGSGALYGWLSYGTAETPGPGYVEYSWESCETPLAPTVTVTTVGDSTVDIEVTPAPVDPNHPRSVVTGWEYAVDGGGAQPLPVTPGSTAGTYRSSIRGLTNATAQTITVRATSASGGGADSAPLAVIPYEPPVVPTHVPASGGDLQASASSVRPGGTMTVAGSGFMPHSTVTVAVYSEPQVLTTVVADAGGAFSVAVVLPDALPPGQHTVVAAGVDPSGVPRYLTRPITVGAVLAYTGTDVTGPLTGGLAALVVGSALLVVGRRPGRTA